MLYLLEVPVYLPSFLLRKQVFMACNSRTDPDIVFANLESLPKEDVTVLSRYGRGIVSYVPIFARALIILNFTPAVQDIEALENIQREQAVPVKLEIEPETYRPLFMGYAYSFNSQENTVAFELLFSEDVQTYRRIKVFKEKELHQQIQPADLQRRSRYLTSIQAKKDVRLRFELENEASSLKRTIQLKTDSEDEPQILLISEKRNSHSFLESLYSLKKVSLGEALQENLLEYSLLVFDGIPINNLGGELSSILYDIYNRRSSSLFFISDSPDFGRKGDNRLVEEILPVELSPRSLKYLPDLGILILLDISASMMGEKLSLAKVSTLELFENLKDSDRVSLLTFWDQYRFLYDFEKKKNINAEVNLSPLIAQGGTDLYKALEEGLERLSRLDMPQKHVIILTDGKTKEADFERLIRKSLFEEISISTLAVGEDIASELLIRLAQKSGGHYYRVLSLEEIPALIFEDRKDISRSSFAEDKFPIFDFSDQQVSQITGMSLFAPKGGSLILYRNQYEDPLLLLEKRERQIILMFLSDIYGHYTPDFLINRSVVRSFKTVFDSILRKNRIKMRIGEAYRSISFTISGEGLLKPSLDVYRANRHIAATKLVRGSFNTYTAVMQLPEIGPYTGIIYSRGVPLTRFSFYFNGFLEGHSTGSHFALASYATIPFKSIRNTWLYPVLFFLCSVYATYRSRRRPLHSEGKKNEGCFSHNGPHAEPLSISRPIGNSS